MYNSCIIPGEEVDELVTYPNDSKYIIVLRNNNMWKLDVLDDKGEIIPLGDLVRSV
jgi:hypothetical protein